MQFLNYAWSGGLVEMPVSAAAGVKAKRPVRAWLFVGRSGYELSFGGFVGISLFSESETWIVIVWL